MSDLHFNTVLEHPVETAFIEVSDSLHLSLMEAREALGFDTMSDLIQEILASSSPNLIPGVDHSLNN